MTQKFEKFDPAPAGNRWGLPDLGLGVGLRAQHFRHVTTKWPAMDWFEIVSENFIDTGGRPMYFLDQVAERFIRKQGAIPSFKGYHAAMGTGGFPGSICISIDHEVVHGIPGDRIIKTGQIVSVDAGAILDGWHGDAARTFVVGEPTPEIRDLVVVRAFWFQAARTADEAEVAIDLAANPAGPSPSHVLKLRLHVGGHDSTAETPMDLFSDAASASRILLRVAERLKSCCWTRMLEDAPAAP